MEIEKLLGLTWDEAKNILQKLDYEVAEISYLNEPPGILRVVRIRQVSSNKVNILLSYNKR
ncbi:MAG: hypothetical protein GXY91_05715 [Clostridia bacterium]|nr:hypothetical protein [Clostridia bacterium]